MFASLASCVIVVCICTCEFLTLAPRVGRGIRRRSTVRRKTIFGSLHSDNEDEEDTSGPSMYA